MLIKKYDSFQKKKTFWSAKQKVKSSRFKYILTADVTFLLKSVMSTIS